MDETTSTHLATQRFIAFTKAARVAGSFDTVLQTFYTKSTQEKVAKLVGWSKLIYSSSYEALKNGNCERIQLKSLGQQVQIDCIGTMRVPSLFLGDQEHRMQLRVYMSEYQGMWYLEQAGYISVVPGDLSNGRTRAGLKFPSSIE